MKRSLALVGSVAAAVIVSKLLIENVLGLEIGPLVEQWLARAGTGSALAVIVLLAADLLLPIPSSLIMILSGAAFGVLWGAILSFVGSVGGEWLGFELTRRYGRRAAVRLVGEDDVRRLERVVERHGAVAVAVTRALPVVMETMSVVAGLSTMTRRAFLLASLVGTAPIVVAYAYAGAVSRQAGSLVPAVVMLVAVAGCGFVWYRARIAPALPERPPGIRGQKPTT